MTKNKLIKLKKNLVLNLQRGERESAFECCSKLLGAAPKDTEVVSLAAQTFEASGSLELTIEYYYRACENKLSKQSRFAFLERAVQISIQHGLFQHGLKPAKRLAKEQPKSAKALFFYGLILYRTKFLLEAITYLEQAHALDPKNLWCLNFLALSYAYSGRTELAIPSLKKSLNLSPYEKQTQLDLLYVYNCWSGADERVVCDAHKYYGNFLESTYPERDFGQRKKNKKLRVAYLSPDFYWHSVAYFFYPALLGSGRQRYEIYCYSDRRATDEMTDKLRENSDVWRDVFDKSDDEILSLMALDNIDILVDLAGYGGSLRMELFAKKAAPIQVSYLGYPNTTGLSRMDYRISDEWADPPSQDDGNYSEKLRRLQGGFLCYSPDMHAPLVSELPALSKQYVCFGSFNTFQKINKEVIETWAKIITKVENSKLLIKAGPLHSEQFCQWVRAEFEALGVDGARISLMGWTPDKASHLGLYDEVDIHLDTFPYNGTTTTCEALWQGVPTVTLAGDVHRARVGVSILSQLELQDYIANSCTEYVDIAVAKAEKLDELSELRKGLRRSLQASPLMDVEVFSNDIACAYEDMFAEYTHALERKTS